jgi:hypothetical protein
MIHRPAVAYNDTDTIGSIHSGSTLPNSVNSIDAPDKSGVATIIIIIPIIIILHYHHKPITIMIIIPLL